jgi:hypothetical protein
LSLFLWFYLNCYLILSYFQILDGSYSPHSQEKHWTSAHGTVSTKGSAASAGTTARLTPGGGTIRDCSHSTGGRRLTRSSTDAAEPRLARGTRQGKKKKMATRLKAKKMKTTLLGATLRRTRYSTTPAKSKLLEMKPQSPLAD